jgi:O-antigen/teichoic acid export membrane protein
MIGEIIPKMLSLLLLPIMTRYLTPADYGVIAYVDAIIIFVFVFSVMSLNSYILREYFQLKEITEQKKMIGNFFLTLVCYNIVSLFIFIGLLSFLFSVLELQFNFFPIMLLALLANFFEIFSIFPQIIYRIQQKAIIYIYFTVSKTILQMGSILILLIYLDQGVLSKYYGVLGINILFAFLSFYIIKQNAVFSINIAQIIDGLKFSLPLVVGALSFIVLDVSDRFILEQYVSLADLGLYSIAYTLGFAVNVIINGGYKAFEPILFKESKNKNFLDVFYSIKKEYMLLIFAIGLLVIMFSQELLYFIASENFYEAYYLVPFLVLAAISKGIYMLYAVLLMIQKKTKVLSIAVLLGAIANIGINLLFIEEYGSVIAAISTFVAFLLMTIIVHIKTFKYYSFALFGEAKEYFILFSMLLMSLFMYYSIDVQLSYLNFFTKLTITFMLIFILLKHYNINIFKILKKAKNAN